MNLLQTFIINLYSILYNLYKLFLHKYLSSAFPFNIYFNDCSINTLNKVIFNNKCFIIINMSISIKPKWLGPKDTKGNTHAFTKVFSTNVFIPKELNLSHKSFSYLTGFIKLVETFKKMTGITDKFDPAKNWGLVIFCDKDLLDGYFKPTKPAYAPQASNLPSNTKMKQKWKDNSTIIIKLYQLYRNYISHIIKMKYDFVKIYTYEDTRLKNTKGHLGLPSTYGSFMRFIPLFDFTGEEGTGASDQELMLKKEFDSIVRVFCINISHSITKNLMTLVSEWEDNKKYICTMERGNYNWGFGNKTFFDTMKIIKEGCSIFNRIPAGLFGVVKGVDEDVVRTGVVRKYKLFKDYITRLIDEYKNNPKIFGYGIDEMILTALFNNDLNLWDEVRYGDGKDTDSKLEMLEEQLTELKEQSTTEQSTITIKKLQRRIKRRKEKIALLKDLFFFYSDSVLDNGIIEDKKINGQFTRSVVYRKIKDRKKANLAKRNQPPEGKVDADGKQILSYNELFTEFNEKLQSQIDEKNISISGVKDIKKFKIYNKNIPKIDTKQLNDLIEKKLTIDNSTNIDLLFTIIDENEDGDFIPTTNENINLPYTTQYSEFVLRKMQSSHIYLSKKFMNEVPELYTFFTINKGDKKYNFLTLLESGFDETKPLILYSNEQLTPDPKTELSFKYYLELLCIDDYLKDKQDTLLSKIINHYTPLTAQKACAMELIGHTTPTQKRHTSNKKPTRKKRRRSRHLNSSKYTLTRHAKRVVKPK